MITYDDKYDVFVSYRRKIKTSAIARIIKLLLQKQNIKCFLDVDSFAAGGYFGEPLLEIITKVKHFILVLSKGDLDACTQKSDWLRKEILCALNVKLEITIVVVDNFLFPCFMSSDDSLCELYTYLTIDYSSISFEKFAFELSSIANKIHKSNDIDFNNIDINRTNTVNFTCRLLQFYDSWKFKTYIFIIPFLLINFILMFLIIINNNRDILYNKDLIITLSIISTFFSGIISIIIVVLCHLLLFLFVKLLSYCILKIKLIKIIDFVNSYNWTNENKQRFIKKYLIKI